MTNKTITLACPFCGGEPKVTRTSGDERDGYALRISYVCKGCGCSRGASGTSAEGGYADNSTVDQRALAAWNTRAALADPVPPAGGEPEVMGFWCVPKDAPLQGRYLERKQISPDGFAESFTDVYHVTALVDRAQVTRLQAEVERLTAQKADAVAVVDETDDGLFIEIIYGDDGSSLRRGDKLYTAPSDRGYVSRLAYDALQSELAACQQQLTKARELLLSTSARLQMAHRNIDRLMELDPKHKVKLLTDALHTITYAYKCIDHPAPNQSAPADKGQGQPVAYGIASQLDRIKNRPEQGHMVYGHANGVYDTPLYADQPAPVAPVAPVMPGRLAIQSHWSEWKISWSEGWNAYLDEFARLNSEPKP